MIPTDKEILKALKIPNFKLEATSKRVCKSCRNKFKCEPYLDSMITSRRFLSSIHVNLYLDIFYNCLLCDNCKQAFLVVPEFKYLKKLFLDYKHLVSDFHKAKYKSIICFNNEY